MIHYISQRILNKIGKRKRHMRGMLEEARCKLPRVLSMESHRVCLIPPPLSCDSICEMLNRKLITGSVPKVFMGSGKLQGLATYKTCA